MDHNQIFCKLKSDTKVFPNLMDYYEQESTVFNEEEQLMSLTSNQFH